MTDAIITTSQNGNAAHSVLIDRAIQDGSIHSEFAASVQICLSGEFLTIRFDAPFDTLNVFEPAIFEGKRIGLWDKDVVEVFINTDSEHPHRYYEFQAAPTGEKMDLLVDLPHRDFLWNSGFTCGVTVDSNRWQTEMSIPLSAITCTDGDRENENPLNWRINFYRHVSRHGLFLAWQPTFSETAHVPERFGTLNLQN